MGRDESGTLARLRKNRSELCAATSEITAVPLAAPQVPLSLPDKPSIAVLPFQNMSGDPEQEYFIDGLVEEVITALSRFKSLFVIGRNSSFTYKGKVADVRTVGRELGVRYVLEGSIRKSATRLRITGQLIECQTGGHLWADRFDGTLEEIFDLQDRIAISVVSAVAPKVDQAEIERARRKPVDNLDAYDCYLRGLARFVEHSTDSDDAALRYFYDAIERDPDFAAPYGMAAHCHVFRLNAGRVVDRTQLEAETRRLSERVAALDSDAKALSEAGHALAYCWDHEKGAALLDRALSMNLNLASGWGLQGYVSLFVGQHAEAREQFARALRLSPRDTSLGDWERGTAVALTLVGNFREGAEWANKALAHQSSRMANFRSGAFANALAGNIKEAQRLAAQVLQLDPDHRISKLRDYTPYRRQEDLELMAKGLRLAGIPE